MNKNDVRYRKYAEKKYGFLTAAAVCFTVVLYAYVIRQGDRADFGDVFVCFICSLSFMYGVVLSLDNVVKYIIKPMLYRQKVEAVITDIELTDSYDGKCYTVTYEYDFKGRTYRVQAPDNREFEPMKGDIETIWINPKIPNTIIEKQWWSGVAAAGYIFIGVLIAAVSGFFLYCFITN